MACGIGVNVHGVGQFLTDRQLLVAVRERHGVSFLKLAQHSVPKAYPVQTHVYNPIKSGSFFGPMNTPEELGPRSSILGRFAGAVLALSRVHLWERAERDTDLVEDRLGEAIRVKVLRIFSRIGN